MSSINLEPKVPAGQPVIASSVKPLNMHKRIIEIACAHFYPLPAEIKKSNRFFLAIF
jgi:hypothetical protein